MNRNVKSFILLPDIWKTVRKVSDNPSNSALSLYGAPDDCPSCQYLESVLQKITTLVLL